MIDAIHIYGLDKAEILRRLYNAARPQGAGFLHYTPEDMTIEEARKYLEENAPYTRFDYLGGRVMKVDVGGDELDPRLYDRDNGPGAAAAALAGLI